jgi:hypothetical protein
MCDRLRTEILRRERNASWLESTDGSITRS